MDIKNFAFFISICAILAGLLVLSFFSVNHKLSINRLNDDNQVSAPDNYAAASITKGSILLLLIIGVIGFLGVSRKKKVTGDIAKNNKGETIPDNQDFNSNDNKLYIQSRKTNSKQ